MRARVRVQSSELQIIIRVKLPILDPVQKSSPVETKIRAKYELCLTSQRNPLLIQGDICEEQYFIFPHNRHPSQLPYASLDLPAW